MSAHHWPALLATAAHWQLLSLAVSGANGPPQWHRLQAEQMIVCYRGFVARMRRLRLRPLRTLTPETFFAVVMGATSMQHSCYMQLCGNGLLILDMQALHTTVTQGCSAGHTDAGADARAGLQGPGGGLVTALVSMS